MKWKLQFLEWRFYFTFNFSCKRILWAVNFKLFYGVTVINVCSPFSARFYSFWEFCFEFHKNRMPKSEIQVFRGHLEIYWDFKIRFLVEVLLFGGISKTYPYKSANLEQNCDFSTLFEVTCFFNGPFYLFYAFPPKNTTNSRLITLIMKILRKFQA